ncbi:MAG: hypothetical protein IIC99_00785 [Chloroflexi bacterium]|nr:hypothetical protein [Chloroflexota bacterium]
MDSDSGFSPSMPKGSLLGRSAPGFHLPSSLDDHGDGYVSLEDFRGRKVVLVFLRHFA